MFAESGLWAPAGMLSGQKVALCGPPDTFVKRTASPRLIGRLAGTNR
jgi:hypothetical protein